MENLPIHKRKWFWFAVVFLTGGIGLAIFLIVEFTKSSSNGPSRDIMMALYEGTNGKTWKNNTGWGSDKGTCDWHGVGCDENGDEIVFIDLSSNGLQGM